MTAFGVAQIRELIAKWRQGVNVIQSVPLCADELEAALLAVPTGCINCGERNDGGFESGLEGHIDEGAVGPFCRQCWELLRETFKVEAALLAVDAPPPQAEKPDEHGWLVELGCSPPQWWTGRPKNGHEFSANAYDAMRFARREDAEGAIGHLVKDGVSEGCKATEHGFARPTRQEGSEP